MAWCQVQEKQKSFEARGAGLVPVRHAGNEKLTFEKLKFRTIGFYFYDELATLPYLGFSSINEADWILENSNISLVYLSIC